MTYDELVSEFAKLHQKNLSDVLAGLDRRVDAVLGGSSTELYSPRTLELKETDTARQTFEHTVKDTLANFAVEDSARFFVAGLRLVGAYQETHRMLRDVAISRQGHKKLMLSVIIGANRRANKIADGLGQQAKDSGANSTT